MAFPCALVVFNLWQIYKQLYWIPNFCHTLQMSQPSLANVCISAWPFRLTRLSLGIRSPWHTLPREFERCVLGVHLAFCRGQKPTICTQEERVTGQRGQKSPIRTRGSNDGGKNPQSASRSHSSKFQNYVSQQLIVLPFSNRSGFHSSRFVCGIPRHVALKKGCHWLMWQQSLRLP